MSSRKRQLFAVEDVVDILLNGRLPNAPPNEENAPPPVKRTSLTNEHVKSILKKDGKIFYGSPKTQAKVSDTLSDSVKAQEPLKAINSPAKLAMTSAEAQPAPVVKLSRSPGPACAHPSPKGSHTKLEALDSPKNNAAKWSTIFFKPSPGGKQDGSTEVKKQQSSFASWMKKSQDKPGEMASQAILDAGQKEFGVVQCKECLMVYELKSPEDELLHIKHHESFNNEALQISSVALKNLSPIRSIDGGLQIYQATKDSTLQKSLVSKCEVVLDVVNRELKRVTDKPCLEKLTNRQKAYICVDPVSCKVVGLCIAEPVSKAFPTMSTEFPMYVERDPRKTVAGIRLIWVAHGWRRKGIAKGLMETVRSTFVYGCVLSKREIAVSSPTSDGFYFFRSYLGGILQENPAGSAGKTSPSVVFLLYE